MLFTLSYVTFGLSLAVVRATTNVDGAYGRWPGSIVNYYLDQRYTQQQQTNINSAILKIQSDLNGCVTWTPVAPTSLLFKLKITAWTDTGVMESYCYGAPGVNMTLRGNGALEQRLVITPGPSGTPRPSGCLDGSLHGPMHFLAIAMGKRNEHQRGDRDDSLMINRGNFAELGAAAYRLYSTTDAYWDPLPYDPCSITHNQPSEFARPGTVSFTVKVPPYFIPKLNQLSNTDCQLLSMLYRGNCNPANCPAMNCAAMIQPGG